MATIHFLCRDRLNLHRAPGPTGVWTSGNWALTEADAAGLVGGSLFLHQTKVTKSYFGGPISSFAQTPDGKIVFTFTFDPSARDVVWRGVSHARAWTSGVLP